jgi:hypothetical protein
MFDMLLDNIYSGCVQNNSPHHRPYNLHNHPLFLLIRTRQKLFDFFDLDPSYLQMSKFKQIPVFDCTARVFWVFIKNILSASMPLQKIPENRVASGG